MRLENKKVLLLLDNYQGHKIDFSKYSNVTVVFIKPQMTGYVQPEDAGYYQTVKERFKAYLRNYEVRFDAIPTLADRCNMLADIMTSQKKELVQTYWRIAGLSEFTNTHREQNYALTVFNLQESDEHRLEEEETQNFLSGGNNEIYEPL